MTLSHRVVRRAIPVAVFATAAIRAHTRRVGSVEERVFRGVNQAPDGLVGPAWVVMQSGSLGAIVVAAGGVCRTVGGRRAAGTFAVGVAVWGGIKLVKPVIGRGRPAEHLADVVVRGTRQTGLGFPSGHAAVAATLALATTQRGSTARVVACAAATAAGLARMYVGAHLPLDVVGGAAVGVIAAMATTPVHGTL